MSSSAFGGSIWGSFQWGSPGSSSSTYTGPPVSQLVYLAWRMAGVLKRPGFGGSPEDQAEALQLLTAIVDQWQARKVYTWAETFRLFTLTPGISPNLIGPNLSSPNFAVPVRPMRLEQDGATLVLTNVTPNVDVPLNVRDADWWNNQRVKSLSTNVPTDVYYEPDFPDGSLYFWPVPDYAYGVRLRLWVTLAQITSLGQQFIAPPAYQMALTTTLAQHLCLTYGLPEPPTLGREAQRARKAVDVNSATKSPRISTEDPGVGGKRTPDFNYYVGY
jgi:hypothetical protein